jgi:hypothetical protein
MKPSLRAAVHIAGLWALAVAQPLFDVLGRGPEFFVAHRADVFDRIILSVTLALLVPGVILGGIVIFRLFSERMAHWLAASAIGILAGVVATQVAYSFGASAWSSTLFVLSLTSALAAFAWLRVAAFGVFLSILAPAALIVPSVFLISTAGGSASAEGGREAATDARRSPVVVFVFDELSLVSLMDGNGRINAVRYPHLAGLAADGIWFRNATAVSDYTRWALPAMLTGRYPTARSEPTPKDHPDTLFSLLGGSHRLEVFEAVTGLCPSSQCVLQDSSRIDRERAIAADLLVVAAHVFLPPSAREGLPDLTQNWAGFGDDGGDADAADDDPSTADTPTTSDWRQGWRSARGKDHLASAKEFIDGIVADDPAATLYFMHTLATHHPARWAPTGQRIANRRQIPGVTRGTIGEDAWVAEQWQYTHLMQAAVADLLVGQLHDRLSAAGRYDAALIVVTADHGASFRPGGRMRNFTPDNAPDVVPVPFIVKLPAGSPGPSRGTIDDSNVEMIDVLPTVADVLGVTVPWAIDGQSAIGAAPRRSEKRLYYNMATRHATYGPNELAVRRDASVKRQAELFGDAASPDFSLPDLRHLIGRELSSFNTIGETQVRLIVENQDAFQKVDVRAPELPVQMIGRVRGGMSAASADIRVVVALNGTIVATTRTWPGRVRWMAMLPPAALKPGANRIDLLVVDPANNSRLLRHP